MTEKTGKACHGSVWNPSKTIRSPSHVHPQEGSWWDHVGRKDSIQGKDWNPLKKHLFYGELEDQTFIWCDDGCQKMQMCVCFFTFFDEKEKHACKVSWIMKRKSFFFVATQFIYEERAKTMRIERLSKQKNVVQNDGNGGMIEHCVVRHGKQTKYLWDQKIGCDVCRVWKCGGGNGHLIYEDLVHDVSHWW